MTREYEHEWSYNSLICALHQLHRCKLISTHGTYIVAMEYALFVVVSFGIRIQRNPRLSISVCARALTTSKLKYMAICTVNGL